jgi:hypothetical protein
MLYRVIAAMFLLVTLDVTATSAAWGQSSADADHTMRAMDLRMRALNSARKSLQQLESRGDDSEAGAVREISDADVTVFADAVKVFTAAFFIRAMKCPDDERFAQQQFGLVVGSFVTTANAQISRVDDNLGHISAPAARAEANSIRDAMIDLREFLKPFAAAD